MEGTKDDLKWFGEGFEGFPKHLPDDTVEYSLFIIDSALKPKEILNRLEAVRKEALKIAKNLMQDYIWQRDDFTLKAEIQSSEGIRYLHGVTNYGDSVEDEWLIVFILQDLSKKFPDLWIKVVDTDGEFLLVEAANALPRWLNPEIADNRVWVNDGKLRIIPLAASQNSSPDKKTTPVSRPLTLDEAYSTISNKPQTLIHSPLIESEAFYRLRNYPAQIKISLHQARVTVPRQLAYILYHCPAAIAPAVEAFYLRDPIAMKQLQKDTSVLVFAPQDLVTISIKFTKVLYAQLKSQHFSSPSAWKDILVEAERAAASDHVKQPELARLEIGLKVTSGFEMMIGDSSHLDNRSVQEVKILLGDLREGVGLPTDEEIASWPDREKDDDEGWLDINFEDFEKELQGKASKGTAAGAGGAFGPQPPSGFGDAKTQADLKKMVQRFEEFLNDEKAGVDGAELDDMDFDNDDEDDDDSEDEDKAVSFDENEFARMMREMMGMPPDGDAMQEKPSTRKTSERLARQIDEPDTDEEEDSDADGEEMRKVMQRIEAELKEAGVLDLDPASSVLAMAEPRQIKDAVKGKDLQGKQEWEDESDEEVNIDFNLAKNLLESFKSQAGMAGPGGNIMSMMGMQMPRDEGSSQSSKPGP